MTEEKPRMLAFHSDPKIKEKYLARVHAHRLADEIIKGEYWKSGKGCAVGCTIHGSNHDKYETELGIPTVLARLEDAFFEGMPNEDAMTWPERFLDAITPGADLSNVWRHFLVWMFEDAEHGTLRLCDPAGAEATKRVIELYKRELAGETISRGEWRDANAASYASFANTASYASHASCASHAAFYAASAKAVSYTAADVANAACAAADAADARAAHCVRMADKLIELMRSVKP